MFFVSDNPEARELYIQKFLTREPAISVLLAAAHFEWTIFRAIMFLSNTSNKELRERLNRCHGLDAYKDIWRDEINAYTSKSQLPQIIQRWSAFKKAFILRHILIHGRETCTTNYAEPRVKLILEAANNIREFGTQQGIDLYNRMPVRRKKTK